MELFQLRYFAAAARRLHFTRAAQECCVAQPSLSQQIANLERELGAPLFVRQGRGVALTDAGRVMLEYAERILAEEEAAKRAIQEVLGVKRGQIAIWTLPTPGQHLLPPLLAAYRRRYPDIAVSLREVAPARAIAEAIASGRADLGIVHQPYEVEGLEERALLREEMALVVPEGHPFAGRTGLALSDAAAEDFVWVSEGATETHPLYAACLAAGFAPRIVCLSGSAQGMQALVAAGMGIALLPRLAIHPPDGAVVVELDEPRPGRTLVAIWRADRISHAARAFIGELGV
ncbi:MAG TPA: LysR substrate-binding domain-containing protein [Chthonomonadaceae bacterium]|nr:LysR substrate-binding domain-containing protein [Chthonomonadaceae bacterium]